MLAVAVVPNGAATMRKAKANGNVPSVGQLSIDTIRHLRGAAFREFRKTVTLEDSARARPLQGQRPPRRSETNRKKITFADLARARRLQGQGRETAADYEEDEEVVEEVDDY